MALNTFFLPFILLSRHQTGFLQQVLLNNRPAKAENHWFTFSSPSSLHMVIDYESGLLAVNRSQGCAWFWSMAQGRQMARTILQTKQRLKSKWCDHAVEKNAILTQNAKINSYIDYSKVVTELLHFSIHSLFSSKNRQENIWHDFKSHLELYKPQKEQNKN